MMKRIKTLEEKIRERLKKSCKSGFVVSDFYDLIPNYKEQIKIDKKKAIKNASTQVGHVLRRLEKENIVVKIGYGAYGKLKWSKFLKKYLIKNGLLGASEEILKKLDLSSEKGTQATKEYNSGLSTQVPTGRVFSVRKETKRALKYEGVKVFYELQTS